jgi:hypothetical protein
LEEGTMVNKIGTVPRGQRIHGGVKIAVKFHPMIFEELCRRAKKDNKSFSATVEDVVKCGLLCLMENDYEEEAA